MKLEPVVNRCNYDIATDFGNFWSYDVIQLSKDLKLNYANLEKEKAVKANWNEAIEARENAFVCGVGHGNDYLYTGQNQDILLDARKPEDLALLQGKYGSFLSCKFGTAMEAFLQAGMKTFMGYSEDFIFGFYNSSNRADPIAATFGKSHFAYDVAFIKAKMNDLTDVEANEVAYRASQAMFQKCFDEATNMNHKQLLLYDKLIQVYGPKAGEGPSQPPTEWSPAVHLTVKVDGEVVHDRDYLEPVDVSSLMEPIAIPTPKTSFWASLKRFFVGG